MVNRKNALPRPSFEFSWNMRSESNIACVLCWRLHATRHDFSTVPPAIVGYVAPKEQRAKQCQVIPARRRWIGIQMQESSSSSTPAFACWMRLGRGGNHMDRVVHLYLSHRPHCMEAKPSAERHTRTYTYIYINKSRECLLNVCHEARLNTAARHGAGNYPRSSGQIKNILEG